MNSKITYKIKHDHLVVIFSGELDNIAVFQFKAKLERIIAINRFHNVIFDLQAVSFIDSSGIGLILGRYNQIKDYGGNLAICGINSHLKKIIQIANLAAIMDVYELSYELLTSEAIA